MNFPTGDIPPNRACPLRSPHPQPHNTWGAAENEEDPPAVGAGCPPPRSAVASASLPPRGVTSGSPPPGAATAVRVSPHPGRIQGHLDVVQSQQRPVTPSSVWVLPAWPRRGEAGAARPRHVPVPLRPPKWQLCQNPKPNHPFLGRKKGSAGSAALPA